MSEFIAAKFAEPQSSGHAPDPFAHLYREIGISAVAAAVYIMSSKPVGPKSVAALDEGRPSVPAILQSDALAA